MPGFFSTWKGLLTQDFGGRYLARILRELIRHNPGFAQRLFSGLGVRFDPRYHEVDCEWSFPSRAKGRKRRADLALRVKDTGKLLALVEIKDEGDTARDGQLSDYADHAAKEDIPFLYLTHSFAEGPDLSIIRKDRHCSHMTFNQLYALLGEFDKPDMPLVVMLREFLAEEAPVFTEELDEKAMRLLLVNGCSLEEGGQGKLGARVRLIKEVPRALESVLSNTAILADQLFDLAHGLFGTRPYVDFYFSQDIKREAILAAAKAANECKDEFYSSDRYSEYARPQRGLMRALGYFKIGDRTGRALAYLSPFLQFTICRNTTGTKKSINGWLGTSLWTKNLGTLPPVFSKPIGRRSGRFKFTQEEAFNAVNATARTVLSNALRKDLAREVQATLTKLRSLL